MENRGSNMNVKCLLPLSIIEMAFQGAHCQRLYSSRRKSKYWPTHVPRKGGKLADLENRRSTLAQQIRQPEPQDEEGGCKAVLHWGKVAWGLLWLWSGWDRKGRVPGGAVHIFNPQLREGSLVCADLLWLNFVMLFSVFAFFF